MKELVGQVVLYNRASRSFDKAEVYQELDQKNFDDFDRLWKPILAKRAAEVRTAAEAASGLATFLIMLMSAIGGAWFPISIMPQFIQQFSKLTLVYWSMEGFSAVLWAGQSFVQVLPILGILAGITAVVMSLAIWRFNRGKIFE